MSLVKGFDSFLDVMDILKNPTKFDAKIKELKHNVDAYTTTIEAVTKLSEVNDYTQSIKAREEESKQVLADAKAEAAAVVTKAKVEADGLMKKAQEATQKAAGDSEAALARVSAAIAYEQRLEASRASLDKDKVDFDAKAKILADLGDELTERKNKLLAAMG